MNQTRELEQQLDACRNKLWVEQKSSLVLAEALSTAKAEIKAMQDALYPFRSKAAASGTGVISMTVEELNSIHYAKQECLSHGEAK